VQKGKAKSEIRKAGKTREWRGETVSAGHPRKKKTKFCGGDAGPGIRRDQRTQGGGDKGVKTSGIPNGTPNQEKGAWDETT